MKLISHLIIHQLIIEIALIALTDVYKPSTTLMAAPRKAEYVYNEVNDLIHLSGPITEDSLVRALHSRFVAKQYYVSSQLAFIMQQSKHHARLTFCMDI